MNTYVNFEIAKLLKQKECVIKPLGLKNKTDYVEGYEWDYEDDVKITEFQFEDHVFYFMYLKPTIAEVVMWLYEKHSIWVSVKGDDNKTFKYELHVWNWYELEKTFRQGHVSFGNGVWDSDSEPFNSPTEAYEAAITYCLENLIK